MWLWMPKRWQRMSDHDRMIALNAKLLRDSGSKLQIERNGGSEHQNRKRWLLWMLNWKWIVTLNAKLKTWLWTPNWRHGSKCLNVNGALNAWMWIMALNAWLQTTNSKCQTVEGWWLWTPKCERWLWTPYCGEMMMAFNVKLRTNDGSEGQTENATLNIKMWTRALNTKLWTMDLNARTEKRWWLWMPKWRSDDDFERRNEEAMMTLNAETEKRWWLWMPKLRSDDGSERRNWEAMMALNAKTENDDGSEHRN